MSTENTNNNLNIQNIFARRNITDKPMPQYDENNSLQNPQDLPKNFNQKILEEFLTGLQDCVKKGESSQLAKCNNFLNQNTTIFNQNLENFKWLGLNVIDDLLNGLNFTKLNNNYIDVNRWFDELLSSAHNISLEQVSLIKKNLRLCTVLNELVSIYNFNMNKKNKDNTSSQIKGIVFMANEYLHGPRYGHSVLNRNVINNVEPYSSMEELINTINQLKHNNSNIARVNVSSNPSSNEELLNKITTLFNASIDDINTRLDTIESRLPAVNPTQNKYNLSGGASNLDHIIAKGTQTELIEAMFKNITGKLSRVNKRITVKDEEAVNKLLSQMKVIEEELLSALNVIDKYLRDQESGNVDISQGSKTLQEMEALVAEKNKLVQRNVKRQVAIINYLGDLHLQLATFP